MAFLNTKAAIIVGALLSGLILGFAFPPTTLGFGAFFALIPLLLLMDRSRPLLHGAIAAYIAMLVFHGMTHWFFAVLPFGHDDSFLGMLGVLYWLVNPLLLALPYIAHHSFVRSYGLRSALILLPFTLTAFEWLKTFTLFWTPELALGYSLVDYTTLIQAADLAGVWGLSFFIAFVNACLTWVLLAIVPSLLRPGDVGPRTWVRTLYLVVLSFVLLFGYGLLRRQTVDVDMALNGHTRWPLAVVQASVDTWSKWTAPLDDQLEAHMKLSAELTANPRNQRPVAVIWPETALPLNMRSEAGLQTMQTLQNEAWMADIPFVFGAIDSTARGQFNAVFYIGPDGDGQVSHKVKLTPYAERSPFEDFWQFGEALDEQSNGVSAWTAGASPGLLNIPVGSDSLRIAPLICIESVYPDYVRMLVQSGADFILVASNDAWADGTGGPEQHFLMSVLRAVETRRYVVSAANSGISGLISPEGIVLEQSRNMDSTGMMLNVQRSSIDTFYTRFGDALPFICLCLYGLGLFGQIFLRQESVTLPTSAADVSDNR